ncbi:hypothetical protein OG413_28390 [Streptomyces sp. NBC_01433]|uniref:hypothetical protein n=1 Tax=Streptomyces sp. NBC_01433 TaxID=2903864 RepID=UPI0022581614|nr:hypothetical protein [Streptomyces sp. NBC_01433]MCX4679176.1 hypothetical protein [Streptomyces sp. NBC_01433]
MHRPHAVKNASIVAPSIGLTSAHHCHTRILHALCNDRLPPHATSGIESRADREFKIMTTRNEYHRTSWSTDGLGPFAATTVEVAATPEDGPRLLRRAARRLCDAAGPQATLVQVGGELTARLEPGLNAMMFVSTEMRSDSAASPLLRLTLRLSGRSGAPPTASLDRWSEIWHRQPFSVPEVARIAGEQPLMNSAVERLRDNQPLAGVAVLLAGHFLTDLIHLVGCLAELGAPLEAMTVLRKDYAYQWRHRVHGHLEEQGVRVADCTDPRAVRKHTAYARREGLRCLALDDGGYITPPLLDQIRDGSLTPDEAANWVGAVEQTMAGIYQLRGREAELPYPVFSVAQSRLKSRIESYWIAQKAVSTALELLPVLKIEGQPALVIGYGNVGAQIAVLLTQRRMRVAVHDSDILRLIDAHESGYVTAQDLGTLPARHEPLLVLGATGHTSMSTQEFKALRGPVYLASVSSRDTEFDLPALESLAAHGPTKHPMSGTSSRTHSLTGGVDVTVLADGRPVNFHETDSISNLHSDLVYAGMLTGACTIATRPAQPGLDPAWADTVLEESGLLRDYYARYGPTPGPPATDVSPCS